MIRAIALDEKTYPFNVNRPQLILLREEDGSVTNKLYKIM